MLIWTLYTSVLLMSGVISMKSTNLLKRFKRWDNNGGMPNNGGTNNGDMSNMFRGTAGVDYPNYKTIPNTNFRCDEQLYEGGLYADVEAQCQVYHVCHDGRKNSFLCGQGTIFNQEILACDYWYSTECEKAPSFYYVNQQIGQPGSLIPPSGNPQDNPHNFQNPNFRQNNPSIDGNPGRNPYQPAGFDTNSKQTGGLVPNNNAQSGGFVPNNNAQSGGFVPNNNAQSGGFVPNNNAQSGGFVPNNNAQSGGFVPNNNAQSGDKQDCCCQKYSYKTPWEFPARATT